MSGSDLRFAGKRAIVTGAASGIGLACAQRLAREGAQVLLLDIAAGEGEQAAQDLRGRGQGAHFRRCDVGDAASLEAAVADEVEGGGIDILVCAAGIGAPAVDFLSMDVADFDRVHRVNMRGPMLLGQLVARQMVETRRGGAIVFIGSVAAILAAGDQVPYCISKAGLAMLVKAMAVSLATSGIRVNAVSPGPVRSEMSDRYMRAPGAREALLQRTPLGRLAEPDEIAATVAFLAHADAGFFTGQSLYPDGGRLALNHIMPSPSQDSGL